MLCYSILCDALLSKMKAMTTVCLIEDISDPGAHSLLQLGPLSVLRLDKMGGLAPGNKWYKLSRMLSEAKAQGMSRVVSFGGAWSNHLHALAAIGAQQGLQTVGIVRGEASETPTAMLRDARAWGMQLVHVSRAEYQQRHDSDYQTRLQQRFHPCLVIPEGGASAEGARGAMAIAQLIQDSGYTGARVIVPVGTGTTLAGLVAGLGAGYHVTGISALKGAHDLEQRVEQALDAIEARSEHRAAWSIEHEYHCGGFGRASAALKEFMLTFEQQHTMALDPVYTGKMLFAIQQMRNSGEFELNEPLLAVHTGGLQGRRGYTWLDT